MTKENQDQNQDQTFEETMGDLETKLEQLEENLKTIVNLTNGDVGESEPLAKYSLLPVLADLIKTQMLMGECVLMLAEDSDMDEDESGAVVVLSAPIVARALFCLWSRTEEISQKLARKIERLIDDQQVGIPLAVYEQLKTVMNENKEDRNLQTLALALMAEQEDKSPIEMLQERIEKKEDQQEKPKDKEEKE